MESSFQLIDYNEPNKGFVFFSEDNIIFEKKETTSRDFIDFGTWCIARDMIEDFNIIGAVFFGIKAIFGAYRVMTIFRMIDSKINPFIINLITGQKKEDIEKISRKPFIINGDFSPENKIIIGPDNYSVVPLMGIIRPYYNGTNPARNPITIESILSSLGA